MTQKQLDTLTADTLELMIHNDMHEAVKLISYLVDKYDLILPIETMPYLNYTSDQIALETLYRSHNIKEPK